MPPELREQVRDFVQIKFEEHKVYDEEAILVQLPPLLRKKVLHFNTKEIFDRVPMFRHAPNATRLALSGLLSPTTLFPGDTIFDINTTADLCYFIYNGSVEIFLPGHVIGKNDKTRKRMGAYGSVAGTEDITCANLGNGCYFGDAGVVLDHSPKRSASARVGPEVAHCDMYAISKPRLREFCRDYPKLWSHLRTVAARRVARVRYKQGLLEHLPPLFRDDLEDLRTSQMNDMRAHKEERMFGKDLYELEEASGGSGRERGESSGGSGDWSSREGDEKGARRSTGSSESKG